MWVDALLEKAYHSPNLGNVSDPLDELFYVILSKRTPFNRSQQIFKELCKKYKPWERLLCVSAEKVASLLQPLGLSAQRASQILAIVRKINEDFGTVDLNSLKSEDMNFARHYLVSLPGVGEKSARCVLMYSFGFDISPMDTHATRVLCRLGLLPKQCSQKRAHQEMDLRLPAGMAKRIHVNLVTHGRKCCSKARPNCSKCPLLKRCDFGLTSKAEPSGH